MKELIWGKSTIRLHGSSAERPHYGPLNLRYLVARSCLRTTLPPRATQSTSSHLVFVPPTSDFPRHVWL